MEKNENLQDKSEIENESTDKDNQENLHQDTSNNLKAFLYLFSALSDLPFLSYFFADLIRVTAFS